MYVLKQYKQLLHHLWHQENENSHLYTLDNIDHDDMYFTNV